MDKRLVRNFFYFDPTKSKIDKILLLAISLGVVATGPKLLGLCISSGLPVAAAATCLVLVTAS